MRFVSVCESGEIDNSMSYLDLNEAKVYNNCNKNCHCQLSVQVLYWQSWEHNKKQNHSQFVVFFDSLSHQKG